MNHITESLDHTAIKRWHYASKKYFDSAVFDVAYCVLHNRDRKVEQEIENIPVSEPNTILNATAKRWFQRLAQPIRLIVENIDKTMEIAASGQHVST